MSHSETFAETFLEAFAEAFIAAFREFFLKHLGILVSRGIFAYSSYKKYLTIDIYIYLL